MDDTATLNQPTANGLPQSGERVTIRGRRWRVAWTARHDGCTSVRVASHDPGSPPATFLHPFDDVRRVERSDRIGRVSRARAMAALRGALLEIAPFPALTAIPDAKIDLLPYQLEPTLSLLAGAATRVLIADDVGLGKTIQAGIAIKELAARNEANHALVVLPAGLMDQWADELQSRLGLRSERVDATWLRLMSRSLPPWVSPWALPGILLVSVDLLKRSEVLAQVAHATWDLVVVDEAHRATGASDRQRAVSHVCCRSRRVVLLTATPHAGDVAAFAQIQQLGALPGEAPRMLTFARTRSAVTRWMRRRARYPRIPLTHDERLMHAALDRYVSRVLRATRRSDREAARLAMMVLKKRALSGAFPLKRSLARRLASLDQPADAREQLDLGFDPDPGGQLVGDDEEPGAVLTASGFSGVTGEREQLGRLIALASNAERDEGKLRVLRRALARTREPVIVFTEYRDTLEHVAQDIAAVSRPVLLHGGLAPDQRRAAVSEFTRGAARVLVATDAAAEGLNLHERCRWVVNLELPWAPLRLIQRAGRVDRIGQQRRVHAWHLVASGTDETRLLLSLSQRAEAAESALARERSVGEHAVAAALLDGADVIASDSPARIAGSAFAAGEREAGRLRGVRTFMACARPSQPRRWRPGIAAVKRRRAFACCLPGDLLMVFSGRVLDAHGSPIAGQLGMARAGAGGGSHEIERQLRRDVKRYETAARADVKRRQAIESLLDRSRPMVQPALFDRRALDSHSEAESAIARARCQLRREPPAPGRGPVLFDFVVGFRVR